MKKNVKCIKKEKCVEIHNTIASKSSICKQFGARWNPEQKIWTWEQTNKHPTFDTDTFLNEYTNGDYNKESNAEYWAHRKQVDKLKADIEKEKEQVATGQSTDRRTQSRRRASKKTIKGTLSYQARRRVCFFVWCNAVLLQNMSSKQSFFTQ